MIYIADKGQNVDSAYHTLVKHIPTDIPIVMVSYSDGFVFNQELLSLKAHEFILVDFIEMGWNYDWANHTIENYHNRFKGDEWKKFHDWAYGKPLLCFKRELREDEATLPGYHPIEYPCLTSPWPIDTKEQFDSRPLDYFQYWGRSNECRIRIQGELWLHSFRKGYQLCDNLYYVSEYLRKESGRRAVSLWVPHWARVDINGLMEVNNLSKLSLSWPGAGFKCFRTEEAPVNSVMVQHRNNFAWSYPWDETNCILVEPGKEIEGIEAALQRDDLYEIYLAGMANVDKYRTENYIKNYIQPILDKL